MTATTSADPRRIGLLVPASDMVSEVDYQRHLPESAVHFTARLHQPPDSGIGTEANYEGLVGSAPDAARSVALANPELIVYSCTAGSFFKGPNWHAELTDILEDATGLPTITTSTSLVTALGALEAKNVFMASPYPEWVNDDERTFLRAHGFEITKILSFDCVKSQEIFRVTPETIVERVLERKSEVQENDVLFLTCTGLRAFDVIERLEQELDRPVISSNSVSLWLALKRLGLDASDAGLGRLSEREPAPVQEVTA